MNIHDFDNLDTLANEAADAALAVTNLTWRVEYERLAAAARALANANLRTAVPVNEVAAGLRTADDHHPPAGS